MSQRPVLMGAMALALMVSMSVTAQDAASVIAAASKAMGAVDLKSIEYSGSGFDYALGQAPNPNAPWPKFIDKTYTRTITFEKPASRMSRIRLQGEDPPRGGGLQPVRGEQTQNQVVVINPNTPWAQQLDIWMTPHGFLKAAQANVATVKSQIVAGTRFDVVSFKGQNNAQVNGYINGQRMVEKVETWIDNAMLGDMLSEAIYTDYKDFAGVKFPTRIVQRQGGYPVLELTIADVKANVPADIQPAPAPAAAPAPVAVTSEKLDEGVFLILGGYAALAVDFTDHIVIIEGPQSEQRASAIIAEAKRLIPGKPIRYVVNTHHHFDHASGLRTFVAEGATIITHEINEPYYEKIFALPHTLNPDNLEKAKRRPTFETMTAKKVLTDGNHVIELHHLQGNGHNDGLIVAYLPKQKLLVQADAYNPAAVDAPVLSPVSPYVANLVAAMDRLKLNVQRIIPIHYPADNRNVMVGELMRVAGR